ncbi:MAG TPA: redoxin family protein [Candidatus Angelobacter sp.]|nr:redoxin family protein [Candidatus Angelobacter sp.]
MKSIRLTPRLVASVVCFLAPVFLATGFGAQSLGESPVAEHKSGSLTHAVALDLSGQSVAPFARADAKAVVFVFISVECPISNRYAPEIKRLDDEFAKSGVRLWLVYPDPDTTVDAIKQHQKDYQLPDRVLRDPHHALVRFARVRVTPETAVFLPDGRLVYRGRIDNRYLALGSERPEATQHELREVLEAVIQGKSSPYTSAPAVGCYIADAK